MATLGVTYLNENHTWSRITRSQYNDWACFLQLRTRGFGLCLPPTQRPSFSLILAEVSPIIGEEHPGALGNYGGGN